MCGNLLKRLGIAKEVALFVDGKIKLGAVNLEKKYGDSKKYLDMSDALNEVYVDSSLAIKKTSEEFKEKSKQIRQLAYFRMVKSSARNKGVGNCGEYSGYVYWRLYKQGVFPISLIFVQDVEIYSNHAFVVIGLTSTEQEQDMNAWKGKDIVICDPWLMRLLKHENIVVSEYQGAYTPEEYIKVTAKYFNNGTKVTNAFALTESLGTLPKLQLESNLKFKNKQK